MATYGPIRIDENFEMATARRRGDSASICRWLREHLHPWLHYKIPYGRRSVEMQLAAFDGFPENDWSTYRAHVDVVRLLKVVRREMNLPN